MNVAILHYHLNRGGVMQVIANHLRALDRAMAGHDCLRIALVYGGRRQGWPSDLTGRLGGIEVVHCEVPEIDYGRAEPGAAEHLADGLRTALVRIGFPPGSTVIHSHNHALGKNLAVPGILVRLARDGYPLLLQIHDFAEDFRPNTYRPMCERLSGGNVESLAEAVYPQASHIHYAVLNSRDARILRRATFDPERVHLLPNPVADFGPLSNRTGARVRLRRRFGVPTGVPLFLYPVRGIARKNLGEMLLWSALAGEGAQFATTLPPLNPDQQPVYRRWKAVAAELGLCCVFETGATGGLTYAENLVAADQILTTSLAEGFGMVFLESWLTRRPLVGRDLPEITSDFVAAGVRLDGLQPCLAVPVSWLGLERFITAVDHAYCDVLAQYGRKPPNGRALRRQIESLVVDGLVDFGFLDAVFQAQVVRRAHADADSRHELLRRNVWLAEAISGDPGSTADVVEHNIRVIRESYSLKTCGDRLAGLYRRILADGVLGCEPGPAPCGTAILSAFLDLPRFRPLRNE